MNNTKKNQQFWNAANDSNFALVLQLLSDHEIDINWADETEECTPVGMAALNDDEKMVKLLLEHGASVIYLESCSSDINKMFNVAALSYKIYGLDFLTEEDTEKLQSLENNLDLQELFINVFKYNLINNDNLPGKNENLAKYFGAVQDTYLDKLSTFLFQKISDIVNNVKELAIKEVEVLEAKLFNQTNENLEHFLASNTAQKAIKNNPEVLNILEKLLENQSLPYDIKIQILQDYTFGIQVETLPIVGEVT